MKNLQSNLTDFSFYATKRKQRGISETIKDFFESLEWDLPECNREALTSLIMEFLEFHEKKEE